MDLFEVITRSSGRRDFYSGTEFNPFLDVKPKATEVCDMDNILNVPPMLKGAGKSEGKLEGMEEAITMGVSDTHMLMMVITLVVLLACIIWLAIDNIKMRTIINMLKLKADA